MPVKKTEISGYGFRRTRPISGNRTEDRDYDRNNDVVSITTHTSDGKSHSHEIQDLGIFGVFRGREKK